MIIYYIEPRVVMGLLADILETILGQNKERYFQNQVETSEIQVDYNEIQGHDDKNLQCEKQIIQCQVTNDRLLGSTSASLRKQYGDETVDRTIRRLAQRRKRDKCSRKAMINELSKKFKPVIDHYLNKKKETEWGNAL